MTTYVVNIFDSLGVFSRSVVSDDYATSSDLALIHVGPLEQYVVETFPGTLRENIQAGRLPIRTDAQVQFFRDSLSVEFPPPIKWCALVSNEVVFEMIDTRRTDDVRLDEHAEYREVAAWTDQEIDDAIAIMQTLLGLPGPLTPQQEETLAVNQRKVATAVKYGRAADANTAYAPLPTSSVVFIKTAADGFEVIQCRDATIYDKIINGVLHKATSSFISPRRAFSLGFDTGAFS